MIDSLLLNLTDRRVYSQVWLQSHRETRVARRDKCTFGPAGGCSGKQLFFLLNAQSYVLYLKNRLIDIKKAMKKGGSNRVQLKIEPFQREGFFKSSPPWSFSLAFSSFLATASYFIHLFLLLTPGRPFFQRKTFCGPSYSKQWSLPIALPPRFQVLA